MSGIVIIGAGECGVRAAFELRGKGYEGLVTLISAEAALPYERPPLSKDRLLESKLIRSQEAYTDKSIDLRLGEQVEVIDTNSKTVSLTGGEILGYDKLLIATGARPRVFPGMENCLTLRTMDDARTILSRFEPGKRVGIIGGGFIGLELAATARQAGADVMVLEAAPRLMGRAVPEAIAEVVHGRHLSEGVDLRTGAQVASADTRSITLKDGTKIHFDLVIAGTGALPNTALAEAAGLEVDNGIRVDACFRTSANDVFAAGDCCNFPWAGANVRLESWQAAQEQGAHAAAAMLGETSDYARIPWFWSDQYDLSLQVAGLFDSSSASVRRNISDNAFVLFQADASGRLIAVAGIGSGNAIAKDIKLAEKLIDRGALLDESAFSDPTVNLKSLLRAA